MEKMRGFQTLTSVDKALNILREIVKDLKEKELEEVSLLDSLGRVCGEDILAPIDVPNYSRSAVDGYAVIAEDTIGASPLNPIELRVVGTSRAGDLEGRLRIDRGEAVEVTTGAPLPLNANAVVMIEDTKEVGKGVIEVYRPVHPSQNVSRKGEDFKLGEIVISKGTKIKPWHIGALASLNISRIKVFSKPRVGVLSTGDELIELGSELEPGKIVNSSKPMLISLIASLGGEPVDLGNVEDDVRLIKSKILSGLNLCDALIVTGGTSVGKSDLVPIVIREFGRVLVHGLAIRPGRPTGFGLVNGKLVFMLSGFPVAALVGFNLLVKPVIEALLRTSTDPSPKIIGKLTRRTPSPSGTRSFVRVRVIKSRGEYLVEPLMLTGSGLISTLTKANGIMVISEDLEGYDEGEEVEVELLGPIISEND
ncbi:MAG: molybdopterin molybdotransferase MoeA [Nitrososphaeria archaeon]|nr:molybdopterin molybdotransferase MoeA [Nitrososphaeria archaeon]MDW7986936.1 molybdopterin molybdotransferase MoeA [Nitrososphaerota archaeon]